MNTLTQATPPRKPKIDRSHRSPQFQPRAPFVRVSRKRPCPACGKHDNCNVSADGRVAYCRRVRGDKQGRDGGWVHLLTHGSTPKLAPPKPKPLPAERASADHVADVLTTLIRRSLTLSDRHKESLLVRGLSESEIGRNGYASAPTPEEGVRIARELSDFGLKGVPGFYRHGGEWRMRDFGPGFFVPVRDERTRIAGCQLRPDDTGEGGPKYIWFSSAGKPHGTSSGAPVHFARPHLLRDASEVIVTEGALKADVASYLMDAPVIAAAGVNNFGPGFPEDLKAEFPNLQTIFIAFDSDWRAKPQVKAALEKLMRELAGVGFRVKVRTWPPQHKGIDDYLLALSQSSKGVAS